MSDRQLQLANLIVYGAPEAPTVTIPTPIDPRVTVGHIDAPDMSDEAIDQQDNDEINAEWDSYQDEDYGADY